MPQIIVAADRGAAFGQGTVTLREGVTVADFHSEHFATQLVERLGWAVEDADQLERVPGQAAGDAELERVPGEVEQTTAEPELAGPERDESRMRPTTDDGPTTDDEYPNAREHAGDREPVTAR